MKASASPTWAIDGAPLAVIWSQVAQQVTSGLAAGSIYASLALALVLIYQTTNVVNFAQGEMATFTTFIAWTIMNHGVPYWPAFALTLLIAFGGGVTVERVLIRPVEHRPELVIVILTIGMLIAINGLTGWIWGPEVKAFDSPFPNRSVIVGEVAISIQDIGTFCICLGHRRRALGLLPVHDARARDALGRVQSGRKPADGRSRRLDARARLGLRGCAGSSRGDDGRADGLPRPGHDARRLDLRVRRGRARRNRQSDRRSSRRPRLGVVINLLGSYVDFVGQELRLPTALAVLLLVLVIRPTGLFGRVVVRRV